MSTLKSTMDTIWGIYSKTQSTYSLTEAFRLYYNAHVVWGCSSSGRALDWQSRGKGFDPPHLHQNVRKRHPLWVFFCIFVLRKRGGEPERQTAKRKASGGRFSGGCGGAIATTDEDAKSLTKRPQIPLVSTTICPKTPALQTFSDILRLFSCLNCQLVCPIGHITSSSFILVKHPTAFFFWISTRIAVFQNGM